MVIILLRHLLAGARPDSGVTVLDEGSSAEIDDILETVLARVRAVAPEQEREVADALDDLVDNWRDAIRDGLVSKYAGWRSPDGALMVPAGTPMRGNDKEPLAEIFPPDRPAWPTLTSLRNVDSESTLHLLNVKRNREVGTNES